MLKIIEDIKFSLRLLAKTPTFTLSSLAIITIGLAVAVSNHGLAQISKPQPFAEGDRFVGVRITDTTTNNANYWNAFNAYGVNLISQRQRQFEFLDAAELSDVNLFDEGLTTRHQLADATPDTLRHTGIAPFLGRHFTEADAGGNRQAVVIMSYRLWENRFLSDPNIIGRNIEIEGQAHEVIGVMPERFNYPLVQDLWRPTIIDDRALLNGDEHFGIFGKLKPAANTESAMVELNLFIQQLADELPQRFENLLAKVVPTGTMLYGDVGSVGVSMRALSVVIFLLASLNLSTLLFTRANQRRQELAVRNALGANVWQLRKQILLESGLLCAMGCLLALGLASIVLQILQATMDEAQQILRSNLNIHFQLQLNSVIYAIGITVAIWLFSSFITVYKVSGAALNKALDGGSKGANSRQGALTSRLIVGVEVVFSCFLLILCGLINYAVTRSFQVDFGSDSENLYIGEFVLVADKFSTPNAQTDFLNNLQAQIMQDEAITSVAFTNIPTGGMNWPAQYPYGIGDRDIRIDQSYPEIITGAVSHHYFSDIGVSLLEGRYFDSSDDADSTPVAIINAHLARELWPNESAVGKLIQLDPDNSGAFLTVVGVSSNLIHGAPLMNEANRFAVYRPQAQHSYYGRTYVVIKTHQPLEVGRLFVQTQQAFAQVDRTIALDNMAPYQDFMRDGSVFNRFFAQIAAWFSAVTLILSVSGVYAIVSRSVFIRRKEIGIRQALGSTAAKVTQLFLGQGLSYLLVGILAGGGAAILIGRVMTTIFPHILEGAALVTAIVIVTLGALVLLASVLPTRSVLAIEPGDSLRNE